MAKHACAITDEQRNRLERNREMLLAVLAGKGAATGPFIQNAGLSLALERFVVDRGSVTVGFEGPCGIERLLQELARTYQGGERWTDGHLVGVGGILAMEGHGQRVPLTAQGGPGAQLVLEVGPAGSLLALLDAVRVFDRQFHVACTTLGCDYELVAQGGNPFVRSPSDVRPVPTAANALLGTYLARTGTRAREIMCSTACTRLAIPLAGEPHDARVFGICSALAPILAFLTDNTLRLCGDSPRETGRMARTRAWAEVDRRRCAQVPDTLAPDFGYAAYERWVEGIPPVFLETDGGLAFSCGTDSCAQVMRERDLTPAEAAQMLSRVLSPVRWAGALELRCADALPLRLAASYAALMKGLLASDASLALVEELLGVSQLDDGQVMGAWKGLRDRGWQTRVYGRPVAQIAHELVAIAGRELEQREERLLLDALAQLWEVRMVPRDTLLRTWERTHERTQTAAELYGEGAVIPYDDLQGEPPAGKTGVIRLDREGRTG